MSPNTSWKWTEDAFQAMAFWLGYQRKRFRNYPIREIAVVTELTALLHAPAKSKALRNECERTFPLVLDREPSSIPDYRQKRVDIAIGPVSSAAAYALEVKVPGKIDIKVLPPWAEDLHRLAWLKQQNPALETRLVLVTESPLPRVWLTETGRAIRTEQLLTDGTSYRIRRVFRGLPLLPKVEGENSRISLNPGPCVVLIEPSSQGQQTLKRISS